MRIVFFLIILGPCYALETVICERISGSYDCQVYSPHEEEYLSDVVHVYESEGFSESEAEHSEEKDENTQTDYASAFFVPYIFPRQ